MAEPLVLLQQRAHESWIWGSDAAELAEQAQRRFQFLARFPADHPTLLLVASRPNFLASLAAACTARCPVVLGNPLWTEAEWQSVLALTQPDLIWGMENWTEQNPTAQQRESWVAASPLQPGWILIPTGGSSGQIRFVIHTWETLMAAVSGFQTHFQVDRVHSCCGLPLYHVSGLMPCLRSLVSGGKLAILPKVLMSEPFSQTDLSQWFLSLVPTQLHRLLQPTPPDWLPQMGTVLLGGAPAWADLLDRARSAHIRLAPTYGMTETAAQVATLKPEEFLNGQESCGQVLPHAQIQIQTAAGSPLPPGQTGMITIQATSLALGYFPDPMPMGDRFQTDDLGYLDAQGYLHVGGRSSQKIITGGENVFPAEVEAAIRATQLVEDIYVLGLPDPDWGEVVTALYVPKSGVMIASIQQALGSQLSKVKHPKRWIAIDSLPHSPQGKLNYAALHEIARQASDP